MTRQTLDDDRGSDGAHLRDADDARLVQAHGSDALEPSRRPRTPCGRSSGRPRPERWRTSSRSSDQTDRSSWTPPIPATARRNRDVFTVAAAEAWQLVDQGSGRKVLVVGNEGWPFPVPLTKVDERLAVRHRRGKGGSARPTNRPQRADGHHDLPHVRRRTAALCRERTRWAAGGTLCQNVPERCRAARTDCSGPRGAARSAVRWVTWWPRPRRRAGRLGTMARSRHRFTATTSRS